MRHRIASLLAALLMALFLPAAAFAACTGPPAGNAGDYMYNNDYHVYQFCNGTNWIAMGNTGGTSLGFSLVANDSTRGVSKVWGDGTYIYFNDYYDHFFGAYTFSGGVLTLKGSYTDANAEYNSVWGDGTYVYVTNTYNNSIEAFTFNGSTFTLKGSYVLPANPMGVWGHGGTIYVADTSAAYALTFNGTTFTVAGSYSIGDTDLRVVWGDGTYIYFGDAYGSNEIYAFTYSAGTFTLKGTDNISTGADDYPVPMSLWGNGGYIYDANNNGYIRAYTFNGTTFALAGSYSVPNAASVWGDGTYIYAGSNSTSSIYAFTFNGSTFTPQGSAYVTPSAVYGLWGDGTYVYAADYANGVDVFHFGGSGVSGSHCASPSGNEGDMMYNHDCHVMQYCDGATWRSAGMTPGCAAPSSGLLGEWKLTDGSGSTAADSSGNGNTGTLKNTPTWVTSGPNGGGLTLASASHQYVDVTDVASLRLAGSWTVSTWGNLTSLPASAHQYTLIGKEDTGGYVNYGLYADNGGFSAGAGWVVAFTTSASTSTAYYAKYATSISTGTWYLVTGVYDSTAQTLTLYVNGASVASQSVTGDTPDAAGGLDLWLGEEDGIGYTNGTVDDARVYNRALSATEVQALYNYTVASGSGCTSPAGVDGDMFYNSDYSVMEYCSIASWIPIGTW